MVWEATKLLTEEFKVGHEWTVVRGSVIDRKSSSRLHTGIEPNVIDPNHG